MSFNIAHEPLPLRELLVAERGGHCGGGQSTGFWAHACMHTCDKCVCACSVYMCALGAHTRNGMCMYVSAHSCMRCPYACNVSAHVYMHVM